MSKCSLPSRGRGPMPSQGVPRDHSPLTFLSPRSGQRDRSNRNQTSPSPAQTPHGPPLPRTSLERPHGPHPPPIQAHLCRNPSSAPLAHVQVALDPACPLPPPGRDLHVHVPCWTHLPLCLWVSAPSNLLPHHHPDPKAGLGVLGGPPWEGKLHEGRAGLV